MTNIFRKYHNDDYASFHYFYNKKIKHFFTPKYNTCQHIKEFILSHCNGDSVYDIITMIIANTFYNEEF